jgi:hypothetical protein
LDKNDRYIEKLKRFTKIGTPVIFDMWATWFVYIATDKWL